MRVPCALRHFDDPGFPKPTDRAFADRMMAAVVEERRLVLHDLLWGVDTFKLKLERFDASFWSRWLRFPTGGDVDVRPSEVRCLTSTADYWAIQIAPGAPYDFAIELRFDKECGPPLIQAWFCNAGYADLPATANG